MKIAIIGTGGVGGYFGAKLALAGHEVTFLARGAHLEAMRSKGLQVKSILGDFLVFPVRATDRITDIGIVDLVLLGVKAWQVKSIASEVKELLGPATMVLPLQNGVMASEELTGVLGPEPVLSGLCRIFSKIAAPGVIDHFGVEPTIVFGEADNRLSDRTQALKAVFDAAGFASVCAADIRTELWKKFILICVGGILALSRTNYGEVRAVPESRALIRALLDEILAVSRKAGAHVPDDYAEKTMKYIDTYPPESTTSMARDIWDGKPSELDYQNGTVVKLGERYGVPTPVNSFVYGCLLPMEKKARNMR